MLDNVLEDFVTLWAVIDPVGTIPVFLTFTASQTARERRRTALRATFIALCVLLAFIIAGQLLIEALGVHLSAFQIAGGLVVFIFALTMIFGESRPEEESRSVVQQGSDVAVFPIAVPSIASPGAMMAVVLLTDNHRFEPMQQAVTTTVMLSVLLITYLLLLVAVPLQRVIGMTGASIISRVMGLILAAVAVDNVLSAIKVYFSLP